VGAYSFLAEGIFTVAAGELLFREPAAVRASACVLRFLRRLPTYLAVHVVHKLALAASATLVVLIPWPAARLLFAQEAALLEGAGVGQALARSAALSRHRGVGCFGLWFVTLCLPFLFGMGAQLAGDALVSFVFQLGRPLGSLWTDGGSGYAVLGVLAAAPVAAAARFLGYIDLRTRKEGWDIQLRFMSIAEREAARVEAA
jgi:hypothetical protein